MGRMRIAAITVSVIVGAAGLVFAQQNPAGAARQQEPARHEWTDVLVHRIAPDQSSIAVIPRSQPTAAPVWFAVAKPDVRSQLKTVQPGDAVLLELLRGADSVAVDAITPLTVAMTLLARLATMGGATLAVLIFASLVSRGSVRWLVVGEDNRYSNSKFQMAVWFWTLISGYLAVVTLRFAAGGGAFIGGVDIPNNLLALSGVSALTFAGAKQIVASRIAQSGGRATLVKPVSRTGPQFPSDLVTDDSGHRPDFGDFQMLVITVLAVTIYASRIVGWLAVVPLTARISLPDVDTTLLGIFGVGQAAYLAKKFTGDSPTTAGPGPVLNTTPPRPSL